MNKKNNVAESCFLTIFPLLLVFYEIAAYLSNDLYLPALPSIMRELQISAYWAQMTLTAWFLGSASLQLVLGPVCDRFGRRPVLLYGGIIFAGANLLCVVSNNITVLLIARFLQGAVVCSVIVAGYASIHELLQSEQAIKTLAWMGGIVVLAPAFGPLIGGLLLIWGSWRFLFFILLIWGIIVLFALKHWMPESLPPNKRHSLHLARIFTDYWLIVRCRGFTINILTFCLIFAAIISWIVIGPLLIIRDFRLSPVWFGVIQAFVFGSYIVATRLVKPMIHRVGVSRLLKLALMITLIGAVFTVICAWLWPQQLTPFVIAQMVFELGAGLALAPLNRLGMEAATQPMGMRVAVFSFLMGVFGVIASVLGGIVYNEQLYSLAWLILALTLAAFVFRFLGAPFSSVKEKLMAS